MKALKSVFARTAIVLAFVVTGCASVGEFDRGDINTLMHDSSQSGGE